MEISKLKQLLGISVDDVTKDVEISFSLEDVEEIICNYCNISAIPEGLTSTAYRMAIDLYREENPGQESVLGSISSISEGDTSTSFKSNESFKETLLKNYEKTLKRYRKVVF